MMWWSTCVSMWHYFRVYYGTMVLYPYSRGIQVVVWQYQLLTILIQFLDDKGFYTLTWLNITLILTHCHILTSWHTVTLPLWHVNTLTMTYRHWHIDIDSILIFITPQNLIYNLVYFILYYEYHYNMYEDVSRVSDSFCWIVCRCVRITPHQPHSHTHNF